MQQLWGFPKLRDVRLGTFLPSYSTTLGSMSHPSEKECHMSTDTSNISVLLYQIFVMALHPTPPTVPCNERLQVTTMTGSF